MKTLINKSNLVDFFVLFQILICIIFMMTANPNLLYMFSAFLPLNILICFSFKGINRYSIIIFGIVFFILIGFAVNNKYPYQLWFPSLILSFNCLLMASLFTSDFSRKITYYICIFLNIYVFFIGSINGFSLDFGELIFKDRSRNIVSAVLILFYILYLNLSFFHNKKISIFLTIFLLINCVILFGRSGILISSVLFIFVLYKYFNRKVFLSALFIFISIAFIFKFVILSYMDTRTNFTSGLESPRKDLFNEYLYNISMEEIFFGRNIYDCCSEIVFMGNPHNSFLLGHMYYGIGYILILIFIIILVLLSKDFVKIFLLSIVILRYSIDTLGLFYILDLPLFSIFYLAYKTYFSNFSYLKK